MPEALPSVIEFSEDLSKAEAPKPLPRGEYLATIRTVGAKTSQKETRYAEVWFHVSSDQYPADYKEGGADGTSIPYRRVSLEDTPRGRYGCRRFIEAIGAPLGKRIDVSEWVGREAVVEIENEKWEGVDRANITRVRAA